MEPRRYYPGAPGLRRPRCTTTCVRVSPAEVYTPAAHPATPLQAAYAAPEYASPAYASLATHRTPPQPCSLGVRPVLEPVPRAAVVPRPAEQHVLPGPSSTASTGRHFTDNLGYGPRGMVWSLPVTDDVPRPAVKPRAVASVTVGRSKARPPSAADAEGEGSAAAATRAAPVRLPPRSGRGAADVDVWGVPLGAAPAAAAAAPPTPAATPSAETPLPHPAYPQPGIQPAQLPPPGAVHRHHHPHPLEVRPSRRSPPPHRDDIVYVTDQAGPRFTPPALAPLPSAASSVRLVSTAVQTLVPPAPPTPPPPPPPLPLRATPPTISLAPPAPVTPPSVRLERPVSSTRVEFEVVETVAAAAPPPPQPQPQLQQVTTTRTATTHSYSSAPPASQPPVASMDTRSVASEQPRVAAEPTPSPSPVAHSVPAGRSEASPPPRSQTPPSVAASAGRPALLPPIVAAETTTTVMTTDVFGEGAAKDRPVQQDAREATAADDKQALSATATTTQPSARVQKYINDLQAASATTGSPSRTLFTEDGFDAASPPRSVRSQSSSVRKTAPMHETATSSHFRPIVTASPVSAAASGYDSPTISEPPRATPS